MKEQKLDHIINKITNNCYNVKCLTQENTQKDDNNRMIIVKATSGKNYEVVDNIKTGDLAMTDRDVTITIGCKELFPFRFSTY